MQTDENLKDITNETKSEFEKSECKDIGKIKKRKYNDLSGIKINNFTVLKYAFFRKGHSYWECRCSCDKIKIVESSALLNGAIKSCGCKTKQRRLESIPNFTDLTGQKFGLLTVIKLFKRDSGAIWHCKCDCGKSRNVFSSRLINGVVSNCGCIKNPKPYRINMEGQKFGSLLVLEYTHGKKNNKEKGTWTCQCDCGNLVYLERDCILKNKLGCRKCFGSKVRGDKSGTWNPNLSEDDRRKRRASFELYFWRKNVYIRDNFTCRVTGVKQSGGLCAHHLESWHANKNLRFELTNGITILKSIHVDFHSKYGYKNNTKEQFDEFVKNLTEEEKQKLILKNNEKKYRKRRK